MNTVRISYWELTGKTLSPDHFVNYWKFLKDNKMSPSASRCSPDGINFDSVDAGKRLVHLSVTLESEKKIETIIYGKGRPIILIPGLGLTAPIWIHQIEELSERFQIIIIHMPGHGLSEMTEDLSYRGMSGVIYEVMNLLQLPLPINIVGACIGGLAALNFSAHYPGCVSTLTLVGTIYDWETDVFTNDALTREKVKKIISFISAFNEKLTADFDALIKTSAMENSMLHVQSKNIDPYAYMQFVIDSIKNDYDVKEVVSKIKVPTLLLTGERDSVVDSRNSRDFHMHISNSEYASIKGAGHYPYVTHFAEFNKKIGDFICRHQ